MVELGLSRGEVLAIVVRAPDILLLSADRNLRPKINFFYGEMHGSKEEVVAVIMTNPSTLLYSLEKRWRPRVEAIREKGIAPCFVDHWRPVSSRTQSQFDFWLETFQT